MNIALLRAPLALFLLIMASMALQGCDALSSDDDDDTGGIVVLTGQVIDDETANPVAGAFVRVLPLDLLFETDENGEFLAEVEIDSTMDLQLRTSADGYTTGSVSVLALAGRTIEVPTFRITSLVGPQPESGRASNILLLSQSAPSVGVRESGSEEVAQITFQLADSVGNPVILGQSADVTFRFGTHPDGGEFLAPTSAKTNNNGQVSVNLSSGTRAGVVQIIAETVVDGVTVRSQPVAMTIHGGLPDQAHFSLGPNRYNFPGLTAYGLTNAISVIVGDKYSNPVRTSTAVYFSSTHGVIQGSTSTDANGQGSVALMSANPLPVDGIAHITGTTADENQGNVTTTIPVVFSGYPFVGINPETAQRNTFYTLTVTDHNGNPLAQGTTINVRAEGTAIKAVGSTAVLLGDTGFRDGINYEHVIRGQGITRFTFGVTDDIDPNNPEQPVVDAVTVTVAGPNGTLEIVMGPGGIAPRVTTQDAAMEPMEGGGYRFWIDK